jgi:hypothetical protein
MKNIIILRGENDKNRLKTTFRTSGYLAKKIKDIKISNRFFCYFVINNSKNQFCYYCNNYDNKKYSEIHFNPLLYYVFYYLYNKL